MKIVEVHRYLLECPLQTPFGYSRTWVERRSALLVEIVTDDGVVGWGEVFGPPRMNIGAIDLLTPLLIGRDPFDSDVIWQRLYASFREHGQKGPVIEALSAIDIALWDAKGKHLGMPVHRLMGGAARMQVPVYATAFFIRPEGDPEKYIPEEAADYVRRGFGAVKLRVGFGVEHDVKIVKAVREAIGSEPKLMVDANQSYDSIHAIRLARRIEEYDITWFEEPVPSDDIEGCRRVREKQSIPVAGGEAEFTRFGFRELLMRGAVDIVQPDVCGAGGLSESKRIADMAQAFGVRCNPHTWGTPIAIAASLQLLAIIPDMPFTLHSIPPMLEMDFSDNPIRDVLLGKAFPIKGGMMSIPDGPGLGLQIDREAFRPFCVE